MPAIALPEPGPTASRTFDQLLGDAIGLLTEAARAHHTPVSGGRDERGDRVDFAEFLTRAVAGATTVNRGAIVARTTPARLRRDMGARPFERTALTRSRTVPGAARAEDAVRSDPEVRDRTGDPTALHSGRIQVRRRRFPGAC